MTARIVRDALADGAPADTGAYTYEPTAIGSQSLVPGVTPITPRDRLMLRVAAPLAAKKPQRACDLGLFDLNARDQLDLFRITGA